MRLLAIESSSERGSVALVEAAGNSEFRVAGYAYHQAYNEHAERLHGLLKRAFDEAGWERGSVELIAVGVGPGSFTGVRVALSVAQGLMMGLGCAGVGIGSLRAIAAGAGDDEQRPRIVVRDARRNEFFVAAYDRDGAELVAPHAVPQEGAPAYLGRLIEEGRVGSEPVLVGTQIEGLPYLETDETVQPDARAVARLASVAPPKSHPVEPCYVRGPNLIRPQLPTSPLAGPRL